MSDGFSLPDAVSARLQTLARQAYPRECCGALLCSASRAIEVHPLDNTAPDPHRGYDVSAAQLLALHQRAEATGQQLVATYHSHPDAPANPSALDLRLAVPGAVLVITSVRSGAAEHPRVWRVIDAATAVEVSSLGDGASAPPARVRGA